MVKIFEETRGEYSSGGGVAKLEDEAETRAYSKVEDARTDRRAFMAAFDEELRTSAPYTSTE